VPKENETKEPEVMSEEEATAVLRNGYYASCTWFNDLPPYYGVNIVQVACKFIDDDGNNDNKGANVNIPGGGQSYTLTSTYQGCCRSYIALSKARAADGKEWVFPNTTTVEDGYCGGNLKIHLVPETKFLAGTPTDAPPFRVIVEAL
jgi:hypothetical protein